MGSRREKANEHAGWWSRLARWWRVPGWLAGERDPLGPMGEDEAVKYLKGRGMKVLARNARVPGGEADIVACDADGRTVVVVEVKTRRVATGAQQPPPERSVDAKKRRKLVRVAQHLVRANGWQGRAVRVDVIAVEWAAGRAPVVRHHAGVIWVQRG